MAWVGTLQRHARQAAEDSYMSVAEHMVCDEVNPLCFFFWKNNATYYANGAYHALVAPFFRHNVLLWLRFSVAQLKQYWTEGE